MSLDSSPISASSFEPPLQNGSYSISDPASGKTAFYKYAKESGGIFVDCLIHDIDLGLWLLSVNREDALIPRRVWATGSIQKYHGLAQFGDVDNAVGVVEFWNGCILNLQGSRTMVDGHDCSTTIYASQGKLKVNVLGRSDRLEVSTRQGEFKNFNQATRLSTALLTTISYCLSTPSQVTTQPYNNAGRNDSPKPSRSKPRK